MKEIESAEALRIFSMWAEKHSPLQVNIRKPDGKSALACKIAEVPEKDSKLSVLILFDEQRLDLIDFTDATFGLGKPEDSAFPEFKERTWVQFLLVELPNGESYLFAEKLVEGARPPR